MKTERFKKPEVILFVGIPASGKSTFFAERFVDTHVRINLDMLRTRPRERKLFEACLEAKQSLVVDNTNVNRADREPYIQKAKVAGFLVAGYVFESVVKDCLARNKNRTDRVIPDIAIVGKAGRLEQPSLDEGFDKLVWVRITKAGFVVED